MEQFEKLKNDISLYSVRITLIRRANLCMQQRGGRFSTVLETVHCIVVLQQKVVIRNKKLIISRNTLYCFNHTINNVCKHYVEQTIGDNRGRRIDN